MRAFPKTVKCIVRCQHMLYVTECSDSRISRLDGAVGKGPAMALAHCLPSRRRSTYLGVDIFQIGSLVRVINYSPFRGLKGTILTIHMIAAAFDEPFCFYLVALEGIQIQEPMWFEFFEVELVAAPQVDPQEDDDLTHKMEPG